jgi:hypothetical protein
METLLAQVVTAVLPAFIHSPNDARVSVAVRCLQAPP